MSALFGCNNNPVVLGAEVAAKAALFYMIKYVCKDTVERNVALSVIHDARQHTAKWGSTAEDKDTPERLALHLAQRAMNHLDMEVTDTQAAAIALGCGIWS